MFSHAMIKAILDDERHEKYGWVVDVDHLHEQFPEEPSDKGLKGPRSIPDQISTALDDETNGRRFRLYDSDGELYYSGRLIVVDEEGEEGDLDFAPLDDLGRGVGCTDIYYWDEDVSKWECEDQEKAQERKSGYRLVVTNLSDAWGETLYRTPVIKDDVNQTGGWVSL